MRVLVATNDLQGTRGGDYAWTVEGELVLAELTECANPRCGCSRGFSGTASSKATTTAMVVDLSHVGAETLTDERLQIEGLPDMIPASVDDHNFLRRTTFHGNHCINIKKTGRFESSLVLP